MFKTILNIKQMIKKTNWEHILFIIGVVSFLLGTLDPLEGSGIIAFGSALMALSTYLKRDKYMKLFLSTFIMIVIGVFFLFYFSSLGGFGGRSKLSWWWGILILPYPIGWIMTIVILIIKAIKRKKTLYK